MLSLLVNRYATPLTTGLFFVSLISGVAIFFHAGDAYFRGMHEWLSMLLILPFAFHMWKNWGPLTTYLKRGTLVWPLAASTAAALAFVVPALLAPAGGSGNPMIALARLATQASLVELAPVLKRSPDDLAAALKEKGFAVASTATTLDAIGTASARDVRAVLSAILSR